MLLVPSSKHEVASHAGACIAADAETLGRQGHRALPDGGPDNPGAPRSVQRAEYLSATSYFVMECATAYVSLKYLYFVV